MMLVAENLNIIRPDVARAVEEMDPEPVIDLVSRCVEAGAEAIDINPGPLVRDPERRMTFLVETVQEVTPLPILLDTANPAALEAGLESVRNPAIINGFSLESGKLSDILPLARKYDVDIIGYLLYPDSRVPKDEAERLEIAVELFQASGEAGIRPEQLIIDPVVAPLIWENGSRQDMDVLAVIRTLPELLGVPVRTIAGLSNLTSGKGPSDAKRLLEAVYLPMLAAAGLSLALVNIFHEPLVRAARAVKALQDPKPFSWPIFQSGQ